MKLTMTAVGLALALATASAAAPASALQAAEAAERKVNISKGAQKAVIELQNAVNANDMASIPAKVTAAQAVATTGEDRYYIGTLQMRAGIAAKDNAMIASAIEAIIASGSAQPDELPLLQLNLGKAYNNLQQYDKSVPALQRAIQLNPNDVDTMILLAETHASRNQPAEAVAGLRQAIAARTAAGQRVDENWYKRALSLAYNAKMPVSVELGREWVKAYPTSANWRDALRVYRNMAKPDDVAVLDVLRLARVTGALDGDVDYNLYVFSAANQRNAREGKLLLDEAAAASKIDPEKPLFKEMHAGLRSKPMPGAEILANSAREALAGTDGAALVVTADRLYGIGDYAKSAELFRAALGKAGADSDLVNLRLGIALARSGDKAGATAALNAVTGPRAEIAKFWLAYLATQA